MPRSQKRNKLKPTRWQPSTTKQLAQNLTYIESNLVKSLSELALTQNPGKSRKIGITGPPGAGKSTLVNELTGEYRRQGLSVAILAIDPSSPFTGGALLGDRVRMQSHAIDDGVFIRSVGTRGAMGGLSAAACAMVRAFEVWGFDIILIETVGVGQTELEIMHLADVTAVVLVPESGDVIQTLKAGILEIAQVFVVNKSDRAGAEQLSHELTALVESEGASKRPIFMTTATENKGVDKLASSLLELSQNVSSDRKLQQSRGQLRALLAAELKDKIDKALSSIKKSSNDAFSLYSKIRPKLSKL